MKTKYAIIILALGFLIDVIATPFKLMHWSYANEMILLRTLLVFVGGILLLYKLLTHPKLKDFLNT